MGGVLRRAPAGGVVSADERCLMKSPSWLNLVDAVRAVRDARGVSGGAACTLLRQACETGVVRSRKRPWPEQPDEPPEPIYDHWSPIPIEDWQGASIDLEHGWLILAGESFCGRTSKSTPMICVIG